MVQKNYKYFCDWRFRKGISIDGMTYDDAMDVNIMDADFYCHFYQNAQFSFMNSDSSFSLDVVTKPISLLSNDIQIAYRDYITYETNYDYYKSWKYANKNTLSSPLAFVENRNYQLYITKKRQMFEEKVMSVLNFYDGPAGFVNINWLIDLLIGFLNETIFELDKLERNFRIINSSLLNDRLEKWIKRDSMSIIEQEAVIKYYVKMSSFDICKKSLFYLESLISYCKKYAVHVSFRKENDKTNPYETLNSNYDFDLIFKNDYKHYANSFLDTFVKFHHQTKKSKYWYRLNYDVMVEIGLAKSKATGLPMTTVARCFKSQFPEIIIATFQDNREDNDYDEVKDVIKSDIIRILNGIDGFPLNNLNLV